MSCQCYFDIAVTKSLQAEGHVIATLVLLKLYTLFGKVMSSECYSPVMVTEYLIRERHVNVTLLLL